MTIQRNGTTRRYSDTVTHEGTVYLVEVPPDPRADFHTQATDLLAGVDRLLAVAGTDRSRLLTVTVYLADMADYDAMNVLWEDWVPEGCAPVRACVQARLANPDLRIEMALTAAA